MKIACRIALLLTLIFARTTFASCTLITNGHTIAQAIGGSTVTSSAVDTTASGGSDLTVLLVSDYTGGGTTGVTDSSSNSYTGLTQYSAVTGRLKIFYKIAPTNNASQTFSTTNSGGFASIGVLAFTCGGAPTFDQATGSSTTVNNPEPTGSLTPGTASSLVVSAMSLFGSSDANSMQVNSGLTVIDQVQYNNGIGLGTAYLSTQTAAINVSWNWLVGGNMLSSDVAVAQAIFAPPASGGGGTTPAMLRLLNVGK